MKFTSRTSNALVAISAAVVLSACGGGSDPVGQTPTDPSVVPQSVTTSVASLIEYAKESLGFTSETSEPATMVDGALATDDTAEPSAL